MFNQLFNLAYQRNRKEAFAFFCVYLVLAALGAGLLGLMLTLIFPRFNIVNAGPGLTQCLTFALCLSMLVIKRQADVTRLLLTTVGLIVAACLLGAWAEMVIVAWQTRLPSLQPMAGTGLTT